MPAASSRRLGGHDGPGEGGVARVSEKVQEGLAQSVDQVLSCDAIRTGGGVGLQTTKHVLQVAAVEGDGEYVGAQGVV